jgi:hypothetical protein
MKRFWLGLKVAPLAVVVLFAGFCTLATLSGCDDGGQIKQEEVKDPDLGADLKLEAPVVDVPAIAADLLAKFKEENEKQIEELKAAIAALQEDLKASAAAKAAADEAARVAENQAAQDAAKKAADDEAAAEKKLKEKLAELAEMQRKMKEATDEFNKAGEDLEKKQALRDKTPGIVVNLVSLSDIDLADIGISFCDDDYECNVYGKADGGATAFKKVFYSRDGVHNLYTVVIDDTAAPITDAKFGKIKIRNFSTTAIPVESIAVMHNGGMKYFMPTYNKSIAANSTMVLDPEKDWGFRFRAQTGTGDANQTTQNIRGTFKSNGQEIIFTRRGGSRKGEIFIKHGHKTADDGFAPTNNLVFNLQVIGGDIWRPLWVEAIAFSQKDLIESGKCYSIGPQHNISSREIRDRTTRDLTIEMSSQTTNEKCYNLLQQGYERTFAKLQESPAPFDYSKSKTYQKVKEQIEEARKFANAIAGDDSSSAMKQLETKSGLIIDGDSCASDKEFELSMRKSQLQLNYIAANTSILKAETVLVDFEIALIDQGEGPTLAAAITAMDAANDALVKAQEKVSAAEKASNAANAAYAMAVSNNIMRGMNAVSSGMGSMDIAEEMLKKKIADAETAKIKADDAVKTANTELTAAQNVVAAAKAALLNAQNAANDDKVNSVEAATGTAKTAAETAKTECEKRKKESFEIVEKQLECPTEVVAVSAAAVVAPPAPVAAPAADD